MTICLSRAKIFKYYDKTRARIDGDDDSLYFVTLVTADNNTGRDIQRRIMAARYFRLRKTFRPNRVYHRTNLTINKMLTRARLY